VRREGFAVAVLGTRDEQEICDYVGQEATLNLCGRTSLPEAAAWLRGARGALGNDSGLSHLAAACSTPTLALYGATDPGGSTPWGPKTAGLRLDGIPCAPCFKAHCAVAGHPCLAGIGPERAWGVLMGLISS
jgi:heptosyltransferase-2